MIALLAVSVALQLAAALLALRLIRITGRLAAWLLIAGAILLMTVRRAITLAEVLRGGRASGADWSVEIVALCISCLMLGGVILIARVFSDLRREELERRRAEERARALERRMLETERFESIALLAGGVGHDLNNLLTAVVGNASLAASELPEGSALRGYLERIDVAAQRGGEIARQLRTIAGVAPPAAAVSDLGAIARDVATLLSPGQRRGAVLKQEIAASAVAVRCDAARLTQVILNLLVNAFEAVADRDGIVVLRTGVAELDEAAIEALRGGSGLQPGPAAVVAVTDNGGGIRPEVLPHVFDPFFSTKANGRGLGLAAVLGIVRSNGGGILLQSSPAGTTFSVYLPLAAANGAVPKEPASGVAA